MKSDPFGLAFRGDLQVLPTLHKDVTPCTNIHICIVEVMAIESSPAGK
jgi:hypothetical protein